MKAVVYHGLGDIRLDSVSDPKLKEDTDALVHLTASAICGTDLHMIRGTFPGMKPGTILGHEGVGIVEEVGKQVRNFKLGDRVVITEDTVTRGTSLLDAARAVRSSGADPVLLVALVDRGGTVTALAAEEGLPFRAVLTASDLGFPFEGG